MTATGGPPVTASRDPVADAVAFARALRADGVPASGERVGAFVAALAALPARDVADVYWAGRLALCARREDVVRYDARFAAAVGARPDERPAPAPERVAAGLHTVDEGGADGPEAVRITGASRRERLRDRDLADLDAAERAEAARLLAGLDLRAAPRRSRRLVPARRGRLDPRRTVRDLLERGGEPARLHRRAPRRRPRRVVLLVDVSGSMRPYAAAFLRFAHVAAAGGRRGGGTEVFTVGTRLTRVTGALAHPDPDAALAAAAAAVPDWSGGTRLGTLLKAFLDGWGRRGTARGAVVVIMSDGWERGDVALLGAQMAALRRLAHRVVWANPLKVRPGYAPLAAGMAAALPHVDDFVEGHSVAALERLGRLVGELD